MTKPLREAVKILIKELGVKGKVLEIGSRQEKNQAEIADFREFFSKEQYVGVDMRAGRGVDVVANAEKLPFKNGEFELVLCLETLEHASKPWLVVEEIQRVLSKKGVAIVSSQQNFPIHLHPSDYFRYTPYGMKELFNKLKNRFVVTISPPFDDEVKLNPVHVIMVGGNTSGEDVLKSLKKALRAGVGKISVHKPYRHRLFDAIKFFRRGVAELAFRQEIEFF